MTDMVSHLTIHPRNQQESPEWHRIPDPSFYVPKGDLAVRLDFVFEDIRDGRFFLEGERSGMATMDDVPGCGGGGVPP